MFSYFRIVNNLVSVTVYHFNPSLIFAGKAKIQVAPLRLVGFKLGLSCDIYKSQGVNIHVYGVRMPGIIV